jgi:hypothetical protein
MNAYRQVERCKHRQADRYIDRQRNLQAGREMYCTSRSTDMQGVMQSDRGRENYRHTDLHVDRPRNVLAGPNAEMQRDIHKVRRRSVRQTCFPKAKKCAGKELRSAEMQRDLRR